MDHRQETALDVLEEQLHAVESDIEDALARLRSAHTDLGRLLEADDALRKSIGLLSNTEMEDAWTMLSALRPRLREVLDEVHMAERAKQARSTRRLFETEPQAVRSGAVRWSSPPEIHVPFLETDESDGSDQLDVEAEAIRVAEESDGRVRVRVLAQYLFIQDGGRYSDERSAYSSVFAQLERSNRFVRGERGEFVLIPEIGADVFDVPDAGDLPFE